MRVRRRPDYVPSSFRLLLIPFMTFVCIYPICFKLGRRLESIFIYFLGRSAERRSTTPSTSQVTCATFPFRNSINPCQFEADFSRGQIGLSMHAKKAYYLPSHPTFLCGVKYQKIATFIGQRDVLPKGRNIRVGMKKDGTWAKQG